MKICASESFTQNNFLKDKMSNSPDIHQLNINIENNIYVQNKNHHRL